MKKFSHRKPYLTTLIIISVVLLVNLFALVQIAKGQPLLFAESTELDWAIKVGQFVVTFGLLVAGLIGFAWYVWKGKTQEQQKGTIEQLQISNGDLRAQNAELRAEVKELEHTAEQLRKKNLRLQGDD